MNRLSMLCVVIGLLVGCNKTDTKPTDEPAIEINSLELPSASGHVILRIAAGCDWTSRIIYDDDARSGWLSVTPASGKADDAEITINVSRNTGQETRSAKVIIEYSYSRTTLAITQNGDTIYALEVCRYAH